MTPSINGRTILTSAAYQAALNAIRAGQTDTLQTLIRDPIDKGNTERIKWMERMIGEAAQRGHAAMVNHLLARMPLGLAASARGLAWAQAVECGHEQVAQQWLPAGATTGEAWFGEAVEANAWRTVLLLLRQGHRPAPLVADRVLAGLACSSGGRDVARALVAHLIPMATAAGGAAGVVVAMRDDAQDLVEISLNKADKLSLKPWLKELANAAVLADRCAWLDRVYQRMERPLVGQEWTMVHLRTALNSHRLAFFEDALDAHPELWERLASHQDERTDLAVRVAWNAPASLNEGDAHPKLRQWFQTLCLGDRVVGLRPVFEALAGQNLGDTEHPRARQWLNALAWLADTETQIQWFREEPETFAHAIARVREQNTPRLASDDVRRPRQRS